MKQCPFCKAELPDEARACSNCGRPLPDQVTPDGSLIHPEASVSSQQEKEPAAPAAPQSASSAEPVPAVIPPQVAPDPANAWDPQLNGWNQQAQQQSGWNPQAQQQGGWSPQTPQQNSWSPQTPQQNNWNPQTPQQNSWNPQAPQQNGWNTQAPQQGGWNPQMQEAMGPQGRIHVLAIAALALGAAASFLNGFLFLPSILAIVFGLVALVQIRRDPLTFRGKGLAILGVVLGVLFLIIYGVMFARIFAQVYEAVQDPEVYQQLKQYLNLT